MEFHEKLNFLMDITKTSNSILARHIIVDPSYVSRLRRGNRNPPRSDDMIEQMSVFFARNLTEKYQLHALAEVMDLRTGINKIDDLKELINLWLLSEKNEQVIVAPKFVNPDISFSSQGKEEYAQMLKDYPSTDGQTSIFYGIEGKRQAALYTLNKMLTFEPQTILLFSDEETSWMTGDVEFAKNWAALMFGIIEKGHKIVIIHTISRNLDEMLKAIGQWMPLYMTGSLEPYYFPKKRDGVFKRTLFVAPGHLAMVSGSIGDDSSYAANLIVEEPNAVYAFTEEFRQFLKMCQPLMLIYTEKDKANAWQTLKEFEDELTNTIQKTEALSLLTMSKELIEKILGNTDIYEEYAKIYEARKQNFKNVLKENKFTEIIKLPKTEALLERKVKIALSFLMTGGEVEYTPALYYEHLQNVIDLLKKEENYHVSIIEAPIDESYMVYVKEDRGAIVAKTSQPPVLLAMNESNMVASFWSFLDSIINKSPVKDKEKSIKILEDYIQKLKPYI